MFLAKSNTALMRQPPYSPDLAPCNFWLFPKLKTTPKGTRFQSRKNIMEKMTAELRSIPEEFKRCLQKVAEAQRIVNSNFCLVLLQYRIGYVFWVIFPRNLYIQMKTAQNCHIFSRFALVGSESDPSFRNVLEYFCLSGFSNLHSPGISLRFWRIVLINIC